MPTEISRVGDLEIDSRECARDPREKAGEAERNIADDVRIIAYELDAFWIVAHRIAHAPERGTRQRVHRNHGDQRPCSYQIINLDLRAEIPAEQFQQFGPVGGDTCFAPEKRPQDQRGRSDQLGDAQRDHGKCRPAALGRDPAEQDREQQSC